MAAGRPQGRMQSRVFDAEGHLVAEAAGEGRVQTHACVPEGGDWIVTGTLQRVATSRAAAPEPETPRRHTAGSRPRRRRRDNGWLAATIAEERRFGVVPIEVWEDPEPIAVDLEGGVYWLVGTEGRAMLTPLSGAQPVHTRGLQLIYEAAEAERIVLEAPAGRWALLRMPEVGPSLQGALRERARGQQRWLGALYRHLRPGRVFSLVRPSPWWLGRGRRVSLPVAESQCRIFVAISDDPAARLRLWVEDEAGDPLVLDEGAGRAVHVAHCGAGTLKLEGVAAPSRVHLIEGGHR